MRTVKAALNVGESEIAEQPLRDAIAFQCGQCCVLGRQFRAVQECEASDLQMSFFGA